MFYHLNRDTDVSVTLVEVVMDDRRNQIKKIDIYCTHEMRYTELKTSQLSFCAVSAAIPEVITGDIPLYTCLIPKSGRPRHFFSQQ